MFGKIWEVITLYDDRLFRPEIVNSKIYDGAIIDAWTFDENSNCASMKSTSMIYFDCSNRRINCPAKGCDSNYKPYQIHKHSLKCPFCFNFTAPLALACTAPKYSSIAVLSSLSPLTGICARFAFRCFRVAESQQWGHYITIACDLLTVSFISISWSLR